MFRGSGPIYFAIGSGSTFKESSDQDTHLTKCGFKTVLLYRAISCIILTYATFQSFNLSFKTCVNSKYWRKYGHYTSKLIIYTDYGTPS